MAWRWDAVGNLYIADNGNHRIRRVDTRGTITTVAGTGARGYGGDGGPALQARLASPTDVAVDAAGNLYIADSRNHRIRRVDTRGIITTVAGTVVGAYSGDGGLAVQAHLRSPTGVTVDAAGNLYIADSRNHRIRRVDRSGTITTVAGTGEEGGSGDGGPAVQAHLRSPTGVTVDAAGNLYISDTGNHRIRRVDTRGSLTTVAGTGARGYSGDGRPATSAYLSVPTAVTVDTSGNLYIADSDNECIRRVDTRGRITTVAGTGARGYSGDGGSAIGASLDSPKGVAVDGTGNLYIADSNNDRIRRVDATGGIVTIAGGGYSGDNGAAIQAQLDNPFGVAMDGAGNLYIADRKNDRIRRVDAKGIITTVAGSSEVGFGGGGGFSGDGGPAVQAQLDRPQGVAVDAAGNVYIATGNRIRRVDARGSSPPSLGLERGVTAGTVARQSRRSWARPQAWRWTPLATSTSPILTATASGAWMPRGLSPPSRGLERGATAGTVARQFRRSWPSPRVLQWTPPATSTFLIPPPPASGAWMPREPSPRSPGPGWRLTAGTMAQRSRHSLTTPQVWRWTPLAISTLPIVATIASA